MAERDAVEVADKWERVRARLRAQGEDGFPAPFPGVDIWKGYDFQLFSAEQMRWLERPESRWARPAMSLEEFLRRHARSHH